MRISQTNMLQSINERGLYPPPGCQWYFRYNFLMAWATRTSYTSKCAQMDPQQLHVPLYLKCRNFIPYAISVFCRKPVGGGYHPFDRQRVNYIIMHRSHSPYI